jgi:hypothetical protein
MFDWIYSNREAFLANYVEIGRNHLEAKTLQEDHNQFTIASNVSQQAAKNIKIIETATCCGLRRKQSQE